MLRTLILVMIIWSGCESGGGGGCSSPAGGSESEKPVIDELRAIRSNLSVTDTTSITVIARDLGGENLSYVWTKSAGTFEGSLTGSDIIWRAPSAAGQKTVTVRVQNETGDFSTKTINLQVSAVTTPIVNISNPTEGQYIAGSVGSINIQAAIPNAPVDSAKCYINGVLLAKQTNHIANAPFSFPWNISALNGEKRIKVQAWTHSLAPLNATTTDSSFVNVFIEGTIGKR